MQIGFYSLAYGIARHRRMIASKLTVSQRCCADRYGALLDKHFARLNDRHKRFVLGLASVFCDMEGSDVLWHLK